MRRALAIVVAALLLQACERQPDAPLRERKGSVVTPQPPVSSSPPAAPPPVAREQKREPASGGNASDVLANKRLVLPVEGVPASALQDTYTAARGSGSHEAIDILAPQGTPVYAVDDGPVAKMFLSKPGGITLYQFDPAGQLAYYYAHLDRYAEGVREGMVLKKGDLVGYVGTSGNARGVPHLHFAIFRLGEKKEWWKGEPVNPYPVLKQAQPR